MPKPMEFQGLTTLVTGASRGIGAQTALAMASRGAFTLIHYAKNKDGAALVLKKIREGGGEGALVEGDLSTSPGIHEFLNLVHEIGRPIDILVNNAGSLVKRSCFLEIDEALWNRVITLNLTSAFLVAQAVLPGMLERHRGFIVNISSVAARFGGGIGAIAYSSAKAALSALTKGMAREFAPHGIRINAVAPGSVDTDYHRAFSTPSMLRATVAATPMGRLGTPPEIAEVVVFLCSEAGNFIQGQTIEVNGGFLMV